MDGSCVLCWLYELIAVFFFFCVCVCGSEPSLIALVTERLQSLLALIRSDVSDSWIRRSAGLPFCVLAMLQGQPLQSHRETSLLSYTLTTLLDICRSVLAASPSTATVPAASTAASKAVAAAAATATATTAGAASNFSPVSAAANWKGLVHALNVMKFIFKDSCLALDATPFIADAMIVAITGFAHAEWAVRNSSLLLFGSILRRTRFEYVSTDCFCPVLIVCFNTHILFVMMAQGWIRQRCDEFGILFTEPVASSVPVATAHAGHI